MAKTINLGKVGVTLGGDYDSSKNYASRTCVFYNHVSWTSKKDVPAGIAPGTNDEYWQKVSERGAQGIQGERGPQGNSAFDGTGIELVNNLTQGGEASALSAEQGKILKTELTELESYAIKTGYFSGQRQRGYIAVEQGNPIVQTDSTSSMLMGKSVIEGETFVYTGRAGARVWLALFYKNGKFVSGVSEKGFQSFKEKEIVIPSGVDFVIFQSAIFDSELEEIGVEFHVESARILKLESDANLIGYYNGRLVDGYLNAKGDVVEGAKSSRLQMSCQPGDIFNYVGWSGNLAVGAFFYHNNELIGTFANPKFGKNQSRIIIPEGCNKVLFQSVQFNEEESDFSISKEFPNALKGNYSRNAEVRKQYLLKDGNFSNPTSFTSKTTEKIPCQPGDIFHYRGWGLNLATICLMYLDNTIVADLHGDFTKGFTKIIIPDGVNFVKFSSAVDDDYTIADKLIFDVYSGEDIENMMTMVENDSILTGKSINWLGDSYVENHSQDESLTWHYLIAQKYGMVYRNYGANGTKIVGTTDTAMSVRWKNMDKDADYVMVVGGTNDFNGQKPIAEFKTGLKEFLQELIAAYPTSRIAVWTPWNDNGEANPAFVTTSNKIPLGDYANAIEDVCQSIGLACFNSFKKANIYSWSPEFRALYFQSPDDIAHLNADGHKRFMTMAESFLLSL